MFRLNPLLKKPFFHVKIWTNVTASTLIIIGCVFHMLYVSDKLAKNKQDLKVLHTKWHNLIKTNIVCHYFASTPLYEALFIGQTYNLIIFIGLDLLLAVIINFADNLQTHDFQVLLWVTASQFSEGLDRQEANDQFEWNNLCPWLESFEDWSQRMDQFLPKYLGQKNQICWHLW